MRIELWTPIYRKKLPEKSVKIYLRRSPIFTIIYKTFRISRRVRRNTDLIRRRDNKFMPEDEILGT
jgi:hypothetical protein